MKYFSAQLRLRFLLTIVMFICITIAESEAFLMTSLEEATDDKKSKDYKNTEDHPDKKMTHQIKRVLIYRNSDCINCDEIKDALKKRDIEYQDIDLTWNRKQKMILRSKAGKDDVSYIFVGNEYIGNHEDLSALMKKGRLIKMLQMKSED